MCDERMGVLEARIAELEDANDELEKKMSDYMETKKSEESYKRMFLDNFDRAEKLQKQTEEQESTIKELRENLVDSEMQIVKLRNTLSWFMGYAKGLERRGKEDGI